MKRIVAYFMIAFACAIGAESSPAQSSPAAQPDNSRERFNVLVDKNIFVRHRPATRTGRRTDSSGGVHRPEESLALTGIVLQEGRHVAFVENRSTNITERLTPGAAILSGKIVAVEFDSLEFESGGQKTHVRIGRNFLGDMSVASVVASPATAPTTSTAKSNATAARSAPAATAPPAPPLGIDGNLSLEERMKLRRQQLSK